jgi:hypothetical protein
MKLGCLLHKNPKKWGSPNFLKSSLRNDRAAPFSLCAAEFRAPPGRQKMARNPALPGWGGCRRRPVAWTSPPAYGGLTPTRCTSRSTRSKDRWWRSSVLGGHQVSRSRPGDARTRAQQNRVGPVWSASGKPPEGAGRPGPPQRGIQLSPYLVANCTPIFCSRGVGSSPPAQTITASLRCT